MSLIISTGSNIGDRVENLNLALEELSKSFQLIEASNIYESPAVDYLNQPDFLNQVLSFEIPKITPTQTIELTLSIEKNLGRKRHIDKGPRTIDIDILFWGTEKIDLDQLTVPHPRLFERSFIVLPLKELKAFETLNNHYSFPEQFSNTAYPFSKN